MSKRIMWLDSLKGLAIVLVVMGHVADGYLSAGTFPEYTKVFQYIYSFLYSFHMPLFLAVSGYVFYTAYCARLREKQDRYVRQLINIGYIYIIFSVLQCVMKTLAAAMVNNSIGLKDFLLIPIKPVSPYWYLYFMLFYYVIFHTAEKYKVRVGICLAAAFAVSIAASCLKFDIVFPLRRMMLYVCFFYMGIFIAKTKEAAEPPKAVTYSCGAVCAAGVVLVAVFNKSLLTVPAIGIIIAAAAVILFIRLFSSVKALGENRLLVFLGGYSLEIYVIHCYVTAAGRAILPKLGISNFALNFLLNTVIATVLPILCAYILKKIRLHDLVFRPTEFFKKKEKTA